MRTNKKYYCTAFILKEYKDNSWIEDSEFLLVFEHNNSGLNNLSQVLSEETSNSSAFLNAMCLLKVCTQL
jgi:hypothetical protein